MALTLLSAGLSEAADSKWKHPLVKQRRLGSPLVEVTPFVFNDRLYLLENNQKFWDIPSAKPGMQFLEDEVRICDVDLVIDDFLGGYYGIAGLPIRWYIDLMHDAVEQSGIKLSMDGHLTAHRSGYLSPEMMKKYVALFDEVERLVAHDPELSARVEEARLPGHVRSARAAVWRPRKPRSNRTALLQSRGA